MQCPTCKKGTIRVIIHFECSCGHHPMVCDKCLAHFAVDHTDPPGPLKLPPEHAISPATELDEALKTDPTISEDDYREAVEGLPTIEECKELYELIASNPDAFDDQDDHDDEDEDDDGPN